MGKRSLWLGSGAAVVVAVGVAAFLQHGGAVARASEAPAGQASTPPGATYQTSIAPADRRAFFGEMHLHTTMSLDAWTFGTKITPDQAYKFARGETVMVPGVQVEVEQGLPSTGDVPAKRPWPLDFAAVTDHSEYLGGLRQLDDPASAFSHTSTGAQLRAAGRRGFVIGEGWVYGGPSYDAQEMAAAASAGNGWNTEMAAANANYQPGKFTTFVAYEWTANPGFGIHMHRNVFFNSDHAPTPFTAVQSSKPEDLWRYLDSVRAHGIDALAIPHNSNLSDGRDFDWNMSNGRPIDEAYAQERALNEPLVEIGQLKGKSETTPELSPNDEFANFEIIDRLYHGETHANQNGSYVRQAYGRGLVIQSKVGVNPFKMGIVGASDIHNGLSASGAANFAGGFSGIDPATMSPKGDAAKRALGMMRPPAAALTGAASENGGPLQNSNAAITGVWAEENTRNSIFAALKRKETFATSGSRIRLRMFGGWDFNAAMIKAADWVAKAYAQGVPMGGDMAAPPAAAKGPSFILQALKDPDGANLDRIQIVKVWLDHGDYKEKVFDVALSGNRHDNAAGHAPAVGDTVDLKTGLYKNTIGATALITVWRDPEFDPKTPAVYYARVLEIPTPRWSTLLAIRSSLPIPAGAPATVQQRAWSSPIWFTPRSSRSAESAGRVQTARLDSR
jgi:hypothetical protein